MSEIHDPKDVSTGHHQLDIPIPFTVTLERCNRHINCLVTWLKSTREGCPLCKALKLNDSLEGYATSLNTELEEHSNG